MFPHALALFRVTHLDRTVSVGLEGTDRAVAGYQEVKQSEDVAAKIRSARCIPSWKGDRP